MPRGAKPKVYAESLVAEVRRLYKDGKTQSEVASAVGVSQKVVWNLMRRHGIRARTAAKRDQQGSRNSSWKGDDADYAAMHLRVATVRGTPSSCKHCGTTRAPRYEWANLTGNYADPFDYVRLCVSCHHKMDGHVANLGEHALRKEVRSA